MNCRFTACSPIVIVLCGCLLFTSMRTRAQEIKPTNETTPKLVDVVGIVQNEDGLPLEGVEIRGQYRMQKLGPLQHLITKTKSDGTYRLDDIPVVDPSVSSLFSIQAALDGYAIAQRNLQSQSIHRPERDPTTIECVDFKLGLSVSAKMRITDQTGMPLSDVSLHSLRSKEPTESSYWTIYEQGRNLIKTDNRGVLIIPGLAAGMQYNLNFTHPEYAQTPAWKVIPGPEQFEIRMDPGLEVEFIVTCESEPAAVSQAVVTATISEEGGSQLLMFPIDVSGRQTARLRDKMATIRIDHPTLKGVPWYFFKPQRKQIEFQLLRPGAVSGRVVDLETGLGVADLWVQLADEELRVLERSRTDESGHYHAEIAEGKYFALVHDESGLWHSSEEKLSVTVRASEETKIPDLSVASLPPLRGQVVLSNGDPVSSAIVFPGFLGDPVISDLEGRFELRLGAIPVDSLRALHPRKGLSMVVSIEKNAQDVLIQLAPEGSIVGLVTDSEGTPLTNIPLGLETRIYVGTGRNASGSTILQRFASRDDGTFRVLGLSPGYEYRVVVNGKSKSFFSNVDQASNQPFEISDSRPERKAISVHDSLLSEVLELARYQTPIPSSFLPLDQGTWLREIGTSNQERAPDERLILLYFLQSSYSVGAIQAVVDLYGDEIQVIAVVPGDSNSDVFGQKLLKQLACPILKDDPHLALISGYQIGVNDMPIGILFSSKKRYVTTITNHENLLFRVRNAVLYGE